MLLIAWLAASPGEAILIATVVLSGLFVAWKLPSPISHALGRRLGGVVHPEGPED